MPRILLLSVCAACALTGCGLSSYIQEQTALAEKRDRFRASVEDHTVQAEPEAIRQAIEIAVREDELKVVGARRIGEVNRYVATPDMPGWVAALQGGFRAAGSTDDYTPEEGCAINVLTVAAGSRIRARCYEMVEEGGFGDGPSRERRVERADPYLTLRVIEQLDPTAAQPLWDREETGHRTLRCARESRSGFTLGCPDPIPRPEPPAEPAPAEPGSAAPG